MITTKVHYVASDGTEFESEEVAKVYESEQTSFTSANAKKFTKGWFGRELLKKHSIDTHGTWEVRGEDPNCDLGGHHHNPYLGTFTGTLKDVINKAVELPNFWGWGSGGKITKIEIEKL